MIKWGRRESMGIRRLRFCRLIRVYCFREMVLLFFSPWDRRFLVVVDLYISSACIMMPMTKKRRKQIEQKGKDVLCEGNHPATEPGSATNLSAIAVVVSMFFADEKRLVPKWELLFILEQFAISVYCEWKADFSIGIQKPYFLMGCR